MKLICFCLLITLYGCNSNCEKLPSSFSSYSEAISKIHSTNFKLDESVNTSKSSWVKGAAYYSCDGSAGYFILKTDNKDYIHKDLPVSVWENFKNAKSYGSYYDNNIKHNYQFVLDK